MQRMKHLFFIFTLILVLAPSVWSVDLNCPGGSWVLVSSQGCGTFATCEVIEGDTKTVYSWNACCDGIGNNCAGCNRIFNQCIVRRGIPPCAADQGVCPGPCGTSCERCNTINSISNYEWRCPAQCVDNDGDGYNAYDAASCPQGNDCNDNDPSINPATVWYKDADNDGYSDGATLAQCAQPDGYKLVSALTATSGDCDDTDPAKNPATIWYKDADGDGYSDGTTITQCERSSGYKLQSELLSSDLDCDDTNPLVTLPSIWYKDTDNDGYSDGTTMTSCTRPGGFKLASELQSTSGDNKDDDGSIYPGAPEICDGKDNNQNGQTDEGCCNVSVSVSPTEVWPQKAGSTTTTSTVTVSLTNPAPPTGCTVNLSIEPVNNSGGHSHDGNRPKGTVNSSVLPIPSGSSQITTAYISSEVSGEERIIATAIGGNTSETMITVRVPGLAGLGNGAYYDIVRGGTNSHPEGTYGTSDTIKTLRKIAKEYFDSTDDRKLSINDLSLSKGGLFDINNNWTTPHSEHRTGTDADINRCDGSGQFCPTCKFLREVVQKIAKGQSRPSLNCESEGRKHIDFD